MFFKSTYKQDKNQLFATDRALQAGGSEVLGHGEDLLAPGQIEIWAPGKASCERHAEDASA